MEAIHDFALEPNNNGAQPFFGHRRNSQWRLPIIWPFLRNPASHRGERPQFLILAFAGLRPHAKLNRMTERTVRRWPLK